jgi:predicted outer membrane repeat protein
MGSTFTDNTADFGGAILSDALDGGESSLVITNSTFTGNSASDQGGAIYNRVLRDATSSPQITESTFTSNSASDGGAIFTAARFDGNSSPMITNSTFTGNTAAFGGAILSIANETSEVNLVLTGVTFNSNSSDTDGGAIYNASRESGTNSLQITGSTFTGNSASGGGAILNETKSNTDSAASSLQVTNTILWSNTAPTGTQVRSFGGGTTATFSHTLIDGGPSGIFNESGASATYLDADGSPAANFAASTNIDADPLFANVDNPAGADGILGTDDDGLRLQAGSPVVDRGTYAPFEAGGVAENVTTDLAGDARRFGLFPDFGAYEVSTITSTSNQITGATDLVGYVQPNGFGGLLLLRDAVDGDLAFSRIDERPESSDLPENVAPVTWEVSATVSPEPTYDLVFDVSSLPGIGAFDQLVLYKSADSGQTWGAVTSLGGALVLDEDRALVAVQDLVGFSQFTIASTDPSNPLPVELARFEAQRTGTESVTVQWQTLSETNNAGFEVQRAPVGSGDPEWNALTTVNGAGTTDTPQSYRFTDTNLPYAADSLSYRLRQIDTDGTESFSEAITVARQVTQAELLPTYPNPVRSQATVRFAVPEQQDVRIDLYDLLGRRVQTVVDTDAEGRTKAQIDVSGLASGTYFLRMQTDGYTETQRITVVR